MKKIVLLLLPSLTLPTAVEANWFEKYNSRYDANEACEIWMLKGFKYTYKVMRRTGLGNENKYYKLYIDDHSYQIKYLVEADKLIERTRNGFLDHA